MITMAWRDCSTHGSFNEAGAWEPRMRGIHPLCRTVTIVRFNEAGAWEPRMSGGGLVADTARVTLQ